MSNSPLLTPPQDEVPVIEIIADLYDTPTADPRDGFNAHIEPLSSFVVEFPPLKSSQDDSQIMDLDGVEARDVVFRSQADTEDGDQIMDLDNTETGDFFFVSQADTGNGHGICSEPVRFICHSTPHLTFLG